MNSFELNHFRSRKQHISAQLDLLAQIARELHAEPKVVELENIKRDMQEETFRFVVVGEFSRGKSTVINALLGERLLPASVEPTTAVLTKIKGGPTRSFKLHYRDGRMAQEVSSAEFKTLVAPSVPPQHDKDQCRQYDERQAELRRLSMVEITYPASICDEGVEIVDTPGTNDLDPLREQITYDYIPRADAILFVLSAKQPFTQSESDFLQNRVLKADIARVFFLLNFADTKTAEELSKVQGYCLSELGPLVEKPRLFPVSARTALRSRALSSAKPTSTGEDGGFGKFEGELAAFLEADRARAKLQRPISRGIRVCGELLAGPIAIRRSTIGLDIPELKKKIDELSPQIRQLQERRDKTLYTFRMRLENRRSALVILMRDGLEEVANAALDAVDRYEGPLKREELGRHIEARVAPVQSQFQSKFKTAACEAFSAEFRKVENDLVHLQVNLQALFEKEIVTDPFSPEFQMERPGLDDGGLALLQISGVGIGLLLLPFLGPLALAAGWFGGMFAGWLEKGNRQQKLGEIRNALDERYRGSIPDSITQFEKTWQQAVRAANAELATAFDRRCEEARHAADIALDKLTDASRTASELRNELDALESRVLKVKGILAGEDITP